MYCLENKINTTQGTSIPGYLWSCGDYHIMSPKHFSCLVIVFLLNFMSLDSAKLK